MNKNALQILLVEDNPTDALLLEDALHGGRPSSHTLTHVQRLDEAMRHLHETGFDVALLDLGLPDSQGLETFARLQREHPTVPILILSGMDDEAIAVQAVQGGAQDFVVKDDLKDHRMERTIRYAIERKRAEQRLLASETSYRRLFETAQDGIIILDADTGQITDANPFFQTLLGYALPEFLGKRLWEIAPFRDKAANLAAFRTLQEKGHIRYENLPLAAKSGKFVDVEFVSNIYAVGAKRVIQCNVRDITERKRAEERIRASEANLSVAQQIAHMGSWELELSDLENLNANPFRWSDEIFRIFGYEPRAFEPSNEAFFQAVHPDDRAVIRHMMADAITNKTPYSLYHRIIRQDGSERIVHEEAEIVCHPHTGEPVKMVGMVHDITERRQAETLLIESQQRLVLATESAQIGIWDWDVAAKTLVWDKQMYALYGINSQDFTGAYEVWLQGLHPEDRAQAVADLDAACDSDKGFHTQFRVVWPNNEVRHIEAHAVALRASDGSALRIIGVNWDITERQKAEESLRRSEERYRSLALATTQIVWVADNQGVIEDMPAWRAFTGQRPDEVRGWNWAEALHPEDRERTLKIWERSVETASVYENEYRVRSAKGDYRLFAVRGVPVLESDGSVREWVGTCTDIHDLRKAEEELDRFFTLSLDMMSIVDTSGNLKRFNPAFCEVLGYTETELMSKPFWERVHPEDRDATIAARQQLANGNSTINIVNRYSGKDGSWRWLEWKSVSVGDGGLVYAVARDITERKRAEDELQKSLALLESVKEGTTDAIYVKDREGRYLMINSAGAQLLGVTPGEVLGRDDSAFFDPETVRVNGEKERVVMETGATSSVEDTGTAAGVKRTYLTLKAPYRNADGEIIGTIGISRDITEQKRLQVQMVQSDRLAAMGALVAGVAHEINNPLAAISGQAQLLQMHPDPQVKNDGAAIKQMTDRATRIVRSLLTFARQTSGTERTSLPLRPLIEATVEIARYHLRASDVEVTLCLAEPDLFPVVNPGQVEQVLLNLINNAEHALRHRDDNRKITITTRCITQEGQDWATIMVCDNGPGIPQNVKDRIFDPFFTTKPQGEGTGLGLSICHGIVEEHGGQMEVESEVGGGTTFTFTLPLSLVGDGDAAPPPYLADRHLLGTFQKPSAPTLVAPCPPPRGRLGAS